MRIYLHALGCKLNQSEIETLARQFLAAGHYIASDARDADICILNTCTVTHIAARKSRQALRRLRRENPDALLVAIGCYAEISPQEIKSLGGVDLIVGNPDKEKLFELLESQVPGLLSSQAGSRAPSKPPQTLGTAGRTRAFVKIQDGCDNACTYCIVTLARGPAVSKPLSEIIQEVKARVAEGYREVVLTGVHIGAYGRERGESLFHLVQRVLNETDIARLRLSSIEPWDFTPDLLPLWRDPRLCRHLHLPLQSGCDATLQRMGRRYTSQQYARILDLARASIPDLAVTTDVIVGFPGETDAEFEASLEFVRQQEFARLHVFPYSPRPGTPAATMPGQVPPAVKEARSRSMHQVGEEATLRFQRKFLGRVLEVLWEQASTMTGPQGLPVWSGLTDNYLRIFTESALPLANTIVPAELIALQEGGIWAKLRSDI